MPNAYRGSATARGLRAHGRLYPLAARNVHRNWVIRHSGRIKSSLNASLDDHLDLLAATAHELCQANSIASQAFGILRRAHLNSSRANVFHRSRGIHSDRMRIGCIPNFNSCISERGLCASIVLKTISKIAHIGRNAERGTPTARQPLIDYDATSLEFSFRQKSDV